MVPFDADLITLVLSMSTIGMLFGVVVSVVMYFIGSMFGVVTKIAS